MPLDVRLLAVVGVVPPFLLLWWLERYERRVREPAPGWRYRVLAAGGLITVPVLIVGLALGQVLPLLEEPHRSLFDAFIVASLVEECFKALCFMLLARGSLAPRTRYGAFLYALHASMGFAVVENVIALLSTPHLEAFSERFLLRAYLSVPMHLTTGGVFGFVLARRKFDQSALGWPAGLALAILLHGAFDALLYAIDHLPEEATALLGVVGALVLVMPLAGLAMLAAFARHLRALDGAQERLTPRGRRKSLPA